MSAHPNERDPATLPPELRDPVVPAAARNWVGRGLGSPVGAVRRLPGASSTAVHALDLADGRRVVLRRYAWAGFVENEPEAPGREVDVLGFLAPTDLPVPEVLLTDLAGEAVGDGVPGVVMSFLPGEVIADPDPARLAEVAARIHAVDPSGLGHTYFPWYADTMTEPPAATGDPDLWERALTVWHGSLPAHDPTTIHRDFHPGNVLWTGEAASGLVDWVNACAGPRGCDVAHCRANLLGWADRAAADAFVAAYEAVTGTTHHPFWEIASVLENDPAHWTAPRLPMAEPRLRDALAELGA